MNMRAIIAAAFLLLAPTASDAATCFWVGGTGTADLSATTHWASSSGGTASTCAATGGVPKNSGDSMTFDAASGGGTVTWNANFNLGSAISSAGTITWGAFTGTLDWSANNNNFTAGTWNGSGTGTRTAHLGSGTFTIGSINSALTNWNMGTTTGLTWDAGTSTISLVMPGSCGTVGVPTDTFAGGSLTYGALSIGACNNGGWQITGNNTFFSVAVSTPLLIILPTTTTISSAFTWAGVSGAELFLRGSASTISVPSGSPSIAWGAMSGITFSGGASFAATSSFGINTSGITISAPSGGGGGGGIIGGGL